MDIKEIKHLAELSKLEFTDDEIEQLSKEFDSIVEMADIIKNAEITGEKNINSIPMAKLREDEEKESFSTEILLQNAPSKRDGSFVVPRIME